MDKKYIECTKCAQCLLDDEDRDWYTSPCNKCKNTRLMIDPKSYLCNMCGEGMCPNITVPSGKWHSDIPHGLVDQSVTGGYESYHIMDMTTYTFSFCEKCLRELFIKCKIPPKLNDGNWEDDLCAHEYRIWKDAGKHHEAYINSKCNVIKDCPNDAVYTLLHNNTTFTEDCLCEEHKDCKYSNSSLTTFINNTLKTFL